jgi:peptidoglycan/LPS O-acetylase OafA/YrhL
VADREGWGTFFGNLFFLQSVVVPPFGSNDPLWSLSYEFWYYVLFPCAWLGLARSTSLLKRAALGATFVTLLCLLGKTIALYFPLWLLGAVIAQLRPAPMLIRHCRTATAVAAVLFLATVTLSHTDRVRSLVGQSVIATDYLNGCACAVLVYVLLHDRAAAGTGRYERTAAALAGFSYTLYVVHMPALVFLRAALAPDEPWLPDLVHLAFAGLLTAAMIGYAAGVAAVTEARTDRVRAALLKWFGTTRGGTGLRDAAADRGARVAGAVDVGGVACHSSSDQGVAE